MPEAISAQQEHGNGYAPLFLWLPNGYSLEKWRGRIVWKEEGGGDQGKSSRSKKGTKEAKGSKVPSLSSDMSVLPHPLWPSKPLWWRM